MTELCTVASWLAIGWTHRATSQRILAREGVRRNRPADGPRDPARRTCKTERAAQIELGKLLERAAADASPRRTPPWRSHGPYAEVADWDLSTRKANEYYIRRIIRVAIRSQMVLAGESLPFVREMSTLQAGLAAFSPRFRSGGRRKPPGGTRPAHPGSRPAGTDGPARAGRYSWARSAAPAGRRG